MNDIRRQQLLEPNVGGGGIVGDPVYGTLENGNNPVADSATISTRKGCWYSIDIPGAKLFPQSVADFIDEQRNSEKIGRLRKHLFAMGWKIERKDEQNRNMTRFRYISHDGVQCYSLLKVCQYLQTMQGLLSDDVSCHSGDMAQEKQGIGNSCFPAAGDTIEVPVHFPDTGQEDQRIGYDSSSFGKNIRAPTHARVLDEEDHPGTANHSDHYSSRSRSKYSDHVFVEKECCPKAVMDYSKLESRKGNFKQNNSVDIKQLILKAKMHLSFDGWMFRYAFKPNKKELRYCSPNGKTFISLITACRAWMEEEMVSGRYDGLFAGDDSQFSQEPYIEFEENSFGLEPSIERLLQYQTNALSIGNGSPNEMPTVSSYNRVKRSQIDDLTDSQKQKNPKKSCVPSDLGGVLDKNDSDPLEPVVTSCNSFQTHKNIDKTRVLYNQGGGLDANEKNALELSKRPTQRSAFLSLLIDNGEVFPGQEVSYLNKRDLLPMAKGQITYEGIKCHCCEKVYGLSNFEAHAGSTNHRPAANIFLEDGRSLHDCQLELTADGSDKNCCVCYDGGELLLCCNCPSVFHSSCVGLLDIPQGEWYCPSCRCGICGESDFDDDSKYFTHKSVIYCDQCRREYHVGCLGDRELIELIRCSKGNWFCSEKCSKMFAYLEHVVGKVYPTSVEGLTWTILRSEKENRDSVGTSDVDPPTKHHSKLLVARRVLHKCFDWMTDPFTNREIITDILFSKESDLNLIKYCGFYTILLERENEVVSVATIRIFDEKVAEMPLIGTSDKYRHQGMCHLLMLSIEMMLSILGVERLLLPSEPSMLELWTHSFGFTKMTKSERSQFLHHTFVQFKGTTLCQKLLTSTRT